MPHLESRYLTGHTVNDIMNEYVGLDTEPHMARYYDSISPLLHAIRDRAKALGYWTSTSAPRITSAESSANSWCIAGAQLVQLSNL